MSRQLALEKELEQVKQINGVVSKIINTVKTTHKNISTSNESIENTNKLIDQWIRILSQSDYTKEILLNSNWQGDDIAIQEKLDKEMELKKELERLKKENDELNKRLNK